MAIVREIKPSEIRSVAHEPQNRNSPRKSGHSDLGEIVIEVLDGFKHYGRVKLPLK